MGRKPKFDLKSLKIGQKMLFPKSKVKYIYQYMNNFRDREPGSDYAKVVTEDGKTYIERTA